jgi:hypothetical protein
MPLRPQAICRVAKGKRAPGETAGSALLPLVTAVRWRAPENRLAP